MRRLHLRVAPRVSQRVVRPARKRLVRAGQAKRGGGAAAIHAARPHALGPRPRRSGVSGGGAGVALALCPHRPGQRRLLLLEGAPRVGGGEGVAGRPLRVGRREGFEELLLLQPPRERLVSGEVRHDGK